MGFVKSLLNGSLFLILLLFFHLGCFTICSNNINPAAEAQLEKRPPTKRRKITTRSPSSSSASNPKPHKSLSLCSILSHLNRFLPFQRRPRQQHEHHHIIKAPPSPLKSLSLSPPVSPAPPVAGTDIVILPCSICGEVLTRPHLLELHQATKHSLSELHDGDSGNNIVRIIFQSGWKGKPPVIHRILKIHNTPTTLARFEEYRDIVRSRAARNRGSIDERCLADGNERLRFYCSTILCALGRNGVAVVGSLTGVCGSPYCSTCGIVRHGFAGKLVDLDGIATHGTGWGAHASLPEELEREFAFLHVRRAMLVCRVLAGKVARGGGEDKEEEKGALFDSVVPLGRRPSAAVEEEELLVFNPRAVLPCFVVIYST